MKTNVFSLQHVGLAVVAVALTFLSFAGTASAKTYYQPTAMPFYYGYQQPVYYQYSYQQQDREELLEELQSLLAQLQRLQNEYQSQYGYGNTVKVHPMVGVGNIRKYNAGVYTYYNSSSDYDVDVETERVRNINDDYATLYGSIDLDDAPYAYVWFEYGTDGDLDEDSRKVRITDSMDDDFGIKVDDLDEDEKYYYRAVAEDPHGDRDYGTIKSFEADDYDDDNDYEDEPDVETGDADDVTDDSAEINGEVDMNDFDNGDVFFVYGEDEDQVEDVEDEDQYTDIDEDGDDLQKYKVYNNLDGERSFWLDIYGLDDNTDYYYRICVEYEDEDDDDTLECGDVEHFETDD